jgi:hypothetical protein
VCQRCFLVIEDSASSSILRLSLSLDAIFLKKREFRERERVLSLIRESEQRSSIYSRRWWHIGRDASIMVSGTSNSQ